MGPRIGRYIGAGQLYGSPRNRLRSHSMDLDLFSSQARRPSLASKKAAV